MVEGEAALTFTTLGTDGGLLSAHDKVVLVIAIKEQKKKNKGLKKRLI